MQSRINKDINILSFYSPQCSTRAKEIYRWDVLYFKATLRKNLERKRKIFSDTQDIYIFQIE